MNKITNKILAVDDNEDNLTLLEDLILHALPGYSTYKAFRGENGLALAASEDPDVILLDVFMPGMDGFEVCQKLKSDPRTGAIPVVFVTALRGDNQIRIQAIEAGADAFLARPIDEFELIAQIRSMQKIKSATVSLLQEKDNLARLVSEQTAEIEKTHTETLKLVQDLHVENEARKNNESALRLSEEALRKSEAKFRAVVENSNDGILFCDLNAKIFYRSPSYTWLNGFNDEERLGHSGFETVHPDDINAVQAYWTELIQNPGKSLSYQYRIRHKDGRWIWVETTGQNLLNIPEVEYVVITSRDITQSKQVEDQIRELNASLEQKVAERTRELEQAQEKLVRQEKLATLGQLAGGVGHELRNPLGVINSSIYYLKLVMPDANDKVRQHLDMIDQEVRIAAQIIGDLLDFGRIVTPNRQTISVSELIQRTLKRFPAPASVRLSLKIPDNLPEIYVDSLQLEQVLGNLTLNACQAMKDVGKLTISARSTVSSSKQADQKGLVTISVKDTGCGIPPENIQRLFEPLFTTKTRGIGLGLPVSKKLAEANGGTIKVKSAPDSGSIFTVILPAVSENA